MKKLLIVLILITLVLLITLPSAAAAWEVKSGNETITKDQTLSGDLIFNGERLEIDGVVKGDLLVVASEVVINGSIEGSVIGLVANKLTINGIVQGNLRLLAGEITISGSVKRNLLLMAIQFFTERNSNLSAGIIGLVRDCRMAGKVDGPVELRCLGSNTILGEFRDKLVIYGVAPVWKSPALVAGSLSDFTQNGKDPRSIKGVKISNYQKRQETFDRNFYNTLFWFSFIWFLGNLLVSLVFNTFFPRTSWEISDPSAVSFRKNLSVGMISLVLIPIIIFLLCFIVVGIPLAILIGSFYIVLFFFSGVPLNLWFGRVLFKSRFKATWLIVLGSLMILIIGMLPLLGFFAQLTFSFAGAGMIVRMIKPQFHEAKTVDLKA